MIELRPLERSEYPAAYAMDETDVPYARYVQCLDLPQYLNFGVHRCLDLPGMSLGVRQGFSLVAVVTVERATQTEAWFHVAKTPRAIAPRELAGLLRRIAGYLFEHGFEALHAMIAPANRAACRLAIRCGMTWRDAAADGDKIFTLTKEEYAKTETATCADAVPAVRHDDEHVWVHVAGSE